MKHTLRTLLVGAAAAGAITVASASVASAAGSDPGTPTASTRADGQAVIDAARARCIAAIDVRLADLSKLTARLGGAKNLTTDHRNKLNSIVSSSQSGLSALKTKIAGDDPTTLKADCDAIFTDYRIYALRVPQDHLTIGFDNSTAAESKLGNVYDKLSAAVTEAKNAGKNVGNADSLLTDMKAKISDAQTQTNGKADAELAFVPSDWNSNHSLLSPYVTALRTGGADMKTAAQDARGVVTILKGLK